jgi:hypothetical protein
VGGRRQAACLFGFFLDASPPFAVLAGRRRTPASIEPLFDVDPPEWMLQSRLKFEELKLVHLSDDAYRARERFSWKKSGSPPWYLPNL